jgi:hypothetical protein
MLAVSLALAAADPAVVKEIEQFRAKHEEDYFLVHQPESRWHDRYGFQSVV